MEVLKNIQIKAKLEITGSTLLSVEEAEALPQHLRPYKDWWWLRSPGYTQSTAALVRNFGGVFVFGLSVNHDNDAARPALKIRNLESSDFKVGDKFEFGGAEFEIVSDNLAFCTGDIGRCAFRKDREAEDANIYEASDIKKFVDEWYKNALKKEYDADNSADREAYERYKKSCLKEDLESWFDQNPDIDLSEEQYDLLVHSNFCERFEKALSRNDAYWDAYWATVESVALEIIKEIKEEK